MTWQGVEGPDSQAPMDLILSKIKYIFQTTKNMTQQGAEGPEHPMHFTLT